MNILKYFIVSLCLFPVLFCNAQELRRPEICTAFVPKSLISNTIPFTSDLNGLDSENNWGQNEESTNKYWIVFGTEKTSSFSLPDSSSSICGTIKVSEKLRIAEVYGDFALVYNEKSPGAVTYPQISGNAEVKGWVPMDKLLLWSSCPIDSSGNNHKAFVSERELLELLGKNSDLSCHYSKSGSQGVDAFALYILRERGDSVLLGRSASVSGKSEDEILGWTNAANVIRWDGRLCIEPVWETDSVRFLAENNEKAILYSGNSLLSKLAEFSFRADQTNRSFRLPANVFRFPLCGEDSLGYYGILPQKYQAPFDNVEYVHGTSFYTRKSGNTGHLLWRKVVLISFAEIDFAIKRLERALSIANNSTGESDDRQRFIDACLEAGDVFGKGSVLSDDVKSVLDTDFVSTEDFLSIMHKFRDKCETLSRIGRSSYKYSSVIDGVKYFIVPIEDLP